MLNRHDGNGLDAFRCVSPTSARVHRVHGVMVRRCEWDLRVDTRVEGGGRPSWLCTRKFSRFASFIKTVQEIHVVTALIFELH